MFFFIWQCRSNNDSKIVSGLVKTIFCFPTTWVIYDGFGIATKNVMSFYEQTSSCNKHTHLDFSQIYINKTADCLQRWQHHILTTVNKMVIVSSGNGWSKLHAILKQKSARVKSLNMNFTLFFRVFFFYNSINFSIIGFSPLFSYLLF